jgi:DNA repair protein RadA/Sms
MAKAHTLFVCQVCHYQSPKWLGRCPECQSWGSFVEEIAAPESTSDVHRYHWGPETVPTSLRDIDEEDVVRLTVDSGEFNRVLGGGIVPGSVILLGGDPGIGKSTLMFQCLHQLAARGTRCLYVSAEESVRQVKLRARRLGTESEEFYVVAATAVEQIIGHVEEFKPEVLVIDSIQAVYTAELSSVPGSIGQVRETSGRLTGLAKGEGIATFLIGHVTKEGAIAGPRILEHMVDTVLYIERNTDSPFRILRAVKNRFGSTNEIGVFEMRDDGLNDIENPSEIFLAERPMHTSGSVVMASMEGTRPILVEIQALATHTAFAVPRRMAMGADFNRLSLLTAVLEKKLGLDLSHHDIFVNVAGGLRIDEPAVDLAIVAAVASSYLDKPVAPDTVVFGEVGLAGEIRGVAYGDMRVQEAARLGFSRCILPARTAERLQVSVAMETLKATDLRGVWNALFSPIDG